jgi:hypothetical protein
MFTFSENTNYDHILTIFSHHASFLILVYVLKARVHYSSFAPGFPRGFHRDCDVSNALSMPVETARKAAKPL